MTGSWTPAASLVLRRRARPSPPSKALPVRKDSTLSSRHFLEEAALQCGICTPGFIVAAKSLLDREPDADEGRIRHWLAGNLCRCTGYDKIIRAVLSAEDITSGRSDRSAAAAAGAGGAEQRDVYND